MKNLLCGLAMLLLAAGPLAAEDDFETASYQSVLQTLDSQDQELSELKTRLASLESQEAVSTPPAVSQGTYSPMTCCNTCVSSGGWTAGAGIYYLQPRWGSNPALATVNAPGALGSNSVIQNFDFHGRVAPVVYAGYTFANGLGIRAQWFTFSDTTNGPSATYTGGLVTTPTTAFQALGAGVAGNTISTSAALGVTAIDLEVTKALNYGNSSYLISGGVRYGHVGQQYGAALTGPPNGLLTDGHNFNGFGPTMAAQARYPFPFARSVGVYGRGRGSMLIGQQHDEVQSALGTGATGNSFSSSNQVVPVAELEVGVDWNRGYRSYGFFMQAGFVVQSWFGVGNSANSNLFATGAPTSTANLDSSNILGLYGIRTSAGVTF